MTNRNWGLTLIGFGAVVLGIAIAISWPVIAISSTFTVHPSGNNGDPILYQRVTLTIAGIAVSGYWLWVILMGMVISGLGALVQGLITWMRR